MEKGFNSSSLETHKKEVIPIDEINFNQGFITFTDKIIKVYAYSCATFHPDQLKHALNS
jgi:hypothetical protein